MIVFAPATSNLNLIYPTTAPLNPMRYTTTVNNTGETWDAVNILSVKVGSLDIEFPVHVYGAVIARDSLDKKCVYLFRRDREEAQTINAKVCNSF